MAISINWSTKVISVPRSYLTDLGSGVYELDIDQFRLDLKDLEDSEAGMVFPKTHNHNTTVLLSGVTYARIFEIINGYTVEFESFASPYTVKCVGANHNIADAKVVNNVSLIVGNSAGLIVVESGGGTTDWTATERQYIRGALGIPGSKLTPYDGQLQIMMGLMQHNFRIINQSYDINNKLTSATVRIYPTASDATNNTNHIKEYVATAIYDGDGNCTDYKMIEN